MVLGMMDTCLPSLLKGPIHMPSSSVCHCYLLSFSGCFLPPLKDFREFSLPFRLSLLPQVTCRLYQLINKGDTWNYKQQKRAENIPKLPCMTLEIYLYLPPTLKASFIPSIYLNIRSLTPLTKAVFLLCKLLSPTISSIFRRLSLHLAILELVMYHFGSWGIDAGGETHTQTNGSEASMLYLKSCNLLLREGATQVVWFTSHPSVDFPVFKLVRNKT